MTDIETLREQILSAVSGHCYENDERADEIMVLIAPLVEDKVRLDWLESKGHPNKSPFCSGTQDSDGGHDWAMRYKIPRAAIDAAIAAEQAE